MRVLVIGKAKTGTTALVSLIRQAIAPCRLVMEPQSVLDFAARSVKERGNEAIKIIYEHFEGRPRHLGAIVHGELGFGVDKVVCITRDVRDELVSRLLYLVRAVRDAAPRRRLPRDQWTAWAAALEEKERRPSEVSFEALCGRFHEIFGVDAWQGLLQCLRFSSAYANFIASAIDRDRYVQTYEAMVRGDTAELAAYLGVTLEDVEAIELGKLEYTRRSGRSGNWRSFFTESDVAALRPIVTEALEDALYEDWELAPVTSLRSEEYSEYVSRIALK